MSARTAVQSSHGMGEDALASASTNAMQTQGKRDQLPSRDEPEPRVSPDPMQGTDRYRLVMPFHLRL